MDYEIIETFKGSPDGSTVVDFQAGETATEKELGPELVKAALAEGWIKPADINTNPDSPPSDDTSTNPEDTHPNPDSPPSDDGSTNPEDAPPNPDSPPSDDGSTNDESPDVKPAKAQTPKPAKTPAKKTGS